MPNSGHSSLAIQLEALLSTAELLQEDRAAVLRTLGLLRGSNVPYTRPGEVTVADESGRKRRKLTSLQTVPSLETTEPRPAVGTSYGFPGYGSTPSIQPTVPSTTTEDKPVAEEGSLDASKRPPGSRKRLTREEVTEIIEQEVQNMIASWKATDLPKLELRARKYWRLAGEGMEPETRDALVNKARRDIQHLEQRLQKNKQEIQILEWSSTWKISAYQRQDKPPSKKRLLEERANTQAQEQPQPQPSVPGSGRKIILRDVTDHNSPGVVIDVSSEIHDPDAAMEEAGMADGAAGETADAQATAQLQAEAAQAEDMEIITEDNMVSDNEVSDDDMDDFIVHDTSGPKSASRKKATPTKVKTAATQENRPSPILHLGKRQHPGNADHAIETWPNRHRDFVRLSHALTRKAEASHPTKRKTRTVIRFTIPAEDEPVEAVHAWSWRDLQDENDGKRLVAKVLLELLDDNSKKNLKFFLSKPPSERLRLFRSALNAARSHRQIVEGMGLAEGIAFVTAARLYHVWWHREQRAYHHPEIVEGIEEEYTDLDVQQFHLFLFKMVPKMVLEKLPFR
ncbi:hypothetical protein H2203_002362 [Taxawa tesnikishii (nom. ined.)]|nr:hypothetical protein H2203_002362 [Dothideales sp. JES 119]